MRLVPAFLLAVSVAGCASGDTNGTGQTVDDGPIEARIKSALEMQDAYTYTVNCPDGGIEAGTDFTCFATPNGLEGVRLQIDTHLDSDGETVESFDPEPLLDN